MWQSNPPHTQQPQKPGLNIGNLHIYLRPFIVCVCVISAISLDQARGASGRAENPVINLELPPQLVLQSSSLGESQKYPLHRFPRGFSWETYSQLTSTQRKH